MSRPVMAALKPVALVRCRRLVGDELGGDCEYCVGVLRLPPRWPSSGVAAGDPRAANISSAC